MLGSFICNFVWKFDEGSGTSAIEELQNHNGTINGTPQWINVTGGKALQFDGTDDYVNAGNTSSLAFSGSVSISAWINFSNFNNSSATVVSMHSSLKGYAIIKDTNSNTLGFWCSDGSDDIGVSTNTLSANTWYHIVGTNDGSTSRIYVNGSLANSTSQGGAASSTGDLKIGMSSDETASSRYWNGYIDEVAVWNDALTAAEVTALYN